MNKIKLVAVFALLLFTLRAHAEDFIVFDLKYTMPIDTPWTRVITNDADWQNIYFELLAVNGIDPTTICHPYFFSPADCSPPPPIVDFDRYQIVIAGLGIRYNGSSNIFVSDVDATYGSTMKIRVIDLNPSDECFVTTVINYPMLAIAVPVSEKPIRLSVKNATLNCQ